MAKFHIIASVGAAPVEVTLTKSKVATRVGDGIYICNVYKSADHSIMMIEELNPVHVETLETLTAAS